MPLRVCTPSAPVREREKEREKEKERERERKRDRGRESKWEKVRKSEKE